MCVRVCDDKESTDGPGKIGNPVGDGMYFLRELVSYQGIGLIVRIPYQKEAARVAATAPGLSQIARGAKHRIRGLGASEGYCTYAAGAMHHTSSPGLCEQDVGWSPMWMVLDCTFPGQAFALTDCV